MCGSSGGGGDTTSEMTVRYPSYIELNHKTFLVASSTNLQNASEFNPYSYGKPIDFVQYDYSDIMYGSGNTISDFTSMQEMFGTYLTDLDVDVLWTSTLDGVQNNVVVSNMVSAEADLINDDIEETTLPRFTTGLRDINSVISSTFSIGRSIIESARTKKLAEFDANLRYKLIPIAEDQWKTKINFNQNIVTSYINMITQMINTEMASETSNYDLNERKYLWNFKLLDFHRANLGVLQGAQSSKGVTEGPGGPSGAQSALGGAMGGAATGAMIGSMGGPMGMGIGAGVGGLLGLAASFF